MPPACQEDTWFAAMNRFLASRHWLTFPDRLVSGIAAGIDGINCETNESLTLAVTQ